MKKKKIILQFGDNPLILYAEPYRHPSQRTSDTPLREVYSGIESSQKLLYHVVDSRDKEIIRLNLLYSHRAFDRGYFLKWFESRSDAEREFDCLNAVGQSAYFHYFPWVYPNILEGCEEDGAPGFFLIQEYIQPVPILEHFKRMYNTKLDLRLILLQYCDALHQVLDAIRALHDFKVPIFHCDIKSDNILFQNNLLKIIDFDNSVFGIKTATRVGTARYLPSYGLQARLRNESLQCLDVLDIHSTITTFLEIFIDIFSTGTLESSKIDDETKLIIEELKRVIRVKNKIYNHKYKRKNGREEGLPSSRRYKKYIIANSCLVDAVKRWAQYTPNNHLVTLFSVIAVDVGQGNAYEACCKNIDVLKKDLYESLLKIVPTDTFSDRARLTHDIEPYRFTEHMENLLATVTTSIFSNFYPILYLDYSEAVGGYDAPAEKTAKFSYELLKAEYESSDSTHYLSERPSLDVGAAFGTAAFQAAKCGFERIICLDISPVFYKLADILWAERKNEHWDSTVKAFLIPELLQVGSICHNLKSHEDAMKHFENLISTKHELFSKYRGHIKMFFLGDYWSLKNKLLPIIAGEKADFQYIVCNNFLHWPWISFRHLNEVAGLEVDMDKEKARLLRHLLHPLLKSLASPGVLAIIEPSKFLENDSCKDKDKDEKFHTNRFTMKDIYKKVHHNIYKDNGLLHKHFKIEQKPPLPREENRFTFSEIKKAIKEELPRCEVKIVDYNFPLQTQDWVRVILGEFTMTTLHFSEESKRKLVKAKPKDIQGFYRDLRELIRSESSSKPEQILEESFYIIYVKKGFLDSLRYSVNQ